NWSQATERTELSSRAWSEPADRERLRKSERCAAARQSRCRRCKFYHPSAARMTSTGFSVTSTEYGVPSAESSRLGTPYSVLSTRSHPPNSPDLPARHIRHVVSISRGRRFGKDGDAVKR